MARSSATAVTRSPQEAENRLDELIQFNPIFSTLMIVDTSGKTIASTDGSGGDQKGTDWFEAAAVGQTFVTDIQPGAAQAYSITFAAPVTDRTGTVVGVLSGDVSNLVLGGVL
jgi:hypothetical protein